ncbi:MAG: hypothetical protein R3C42_07995 [Parvularculaceae bacterium]
MKRQSRKRTINRRRRRRAGGQPAAVAASAEELGAEKALTQEQKSQIATLNAQLAALRRQLASLQEALDAAEAKDREQQAQIENLSQRLNAALARKVQELQEVRSRFFEALRAALGDRTDIKVVGDRFVFESDILSAHVRRRSARPENLS